MLYAFAVIAFTVAGLAAVSSTITVADSSAAPQPGCNERCKPFLIVNSIEPGYKCPFVGCDVNGVCRYIC
jgi:hypothetical protein